MRMLSEILTGKYPLSSRDALVLSLVGNNAISFL